MKIHVNKNITYLDLALLDEMMSRRMKMIVELVR